MPMRFLAALLLVFAVARPAVGAGLDVQRVVSPGGIEAWLVSDDLVPVISMDVAWRGGAATDPEGRAGLANMVSGLLDEGAGDLDSQAFQSRLENLAISLKFDAGYDNFVGSLKTLSQHRADAFDLFRLAITAPRFDEEPVERIRQQILSALAREEERAPRMAHRRWREIAFGDHPYGRAVDGSPETVAAIVRDDLAGFVSRRLARDNLVVAVAGDITADELGPLLDSTFGGLPATAEPIAITDVSPARAGTVEVVRRGIPQAVAVFGQEGVKRDDPEYYAAYLMAHILGGGGFSARLMEEVREKRGLAYSVWAGLNPDRHAGLILGSVGTVNARLGESLDLIRGEWRRMVEEGVTEDELEAAKNSVIGSFVLRMTSSDGISGVLLAVQLEDLGIDYLERRESLIRAVTRDDVQRVARRLLDPDRLTVVIVGDPPAPLADEQTASPEKG